METWTFQVNIYIFKNRCIIKYIFTSNNIRTYNIHTNNLFNILIRITFYMLFV